MIIAWTGKQKCQTIKEFCLMFSKLLIKLIDESIVPAILLLVTRLVSVVAVARFNNIPFEISPNGFAFKNAADYLFVNSYSIFYMIVVVTLGLLFVLTKSLFFHETHITPGLSAKLHNYKMRSMIQNSYDLYTQGSIWLSYCYLLLILSGFMYYFKFIFPWVFFISAVLTVISTVLLVIDIEEELHILKKNVPIYDDVDVALDFDNLEDDE
jgi:hypothetical protein